MPDVMKNIYATITNHVQMVGYREIVEAHGRARGLAGFVFNDVDGSVKVMARGLEPILSEFIHDLKIIRPDTAIETKEISEDIRLPSPFGRITMDEMREISERLDLGVNILAEHTGILNNHTTILKENTHALYSINDKLDTLADKLDTLPERLAEAMKK